MFFSQKECINMQEGRRKKKREKLISKNVCGHHWRCGEHQETGVDAWVGEKEFGIADGNGV